MKRLINITLIVILGIALRFISINKVDGLWNDEYISWLIAAKPFSNGFVNSMLSQCHMPLYYIYLKLFMTFFGQSDLALRLSSVLTGVLSIVAMYFVGKEKDEKTGLLCASFTAISSFAIYYSQEVRLYSLLFLISALTLLFIIKSIKQPNIKNIMWCVFFNFLILITHTIGFVFVFFNIVLLSVYLFNKYKKLVIITWSSIFTCTLIAMPFVLKIFTTQSFSQWWGHFSFSKILFLFTDYFSPVVTNFTNAPDNFFYMPKLAWLMIIPTLIAIFCIIKALIKNKLNISLSLVASGTVIVLVIAAILGKLVFITKYSIEIYPILIYLACFGLSEIKNIKLKNFLIILYATLSLGYIILAPYSAPKIRRAEGQKIPVDIVKQLNLKKDDIILLEYYPQSRFEKYFDFSNYRVISIDKGNFTDFLSKDTTYNDAYKFGKDLYRNMFKLDENKYFDDIIYNRIIKQLKPDQSITIVALNSVSYHSPNALKAIAENDTKYEKEPLLFMVFSYVRNKTYIEMMRHLAISNFAQKGNWTVVKFTKLNNIKEK